MTQPHLTFNSNLGEAVSLAMTQINQGKRNHGQVAIQDEVDQFYKTQVVPLKANIERELVSIGRSIDSQIGLAQQMRASIETSNTAKSRWPDMR